MKPNCLKYILFIFFFNICRTELAPEFPDSKQSTVVTETLLLKEKQKIAQEYLTSLDDVKEDWIDPFRMLMPAKDPSKPLVKNPIKRFDPPKLHTDEQPVFVDFRRELISESYLPDDAVLPGIEKSTGIFSKERHQICVLDSIYLARWIKKLVSKIDSELEPEPISLTIPFDLDVIKYLNDLPLDKTLDKSKLDEFICEMISRSYVERKSRIDWSAVRANFVSGVQFSGIALVICGCVYVIWQCFVSRPFTTFLWFFALGNIVWHWIHLYQQKLAHKHSELASMTIPDECRKHDFGLMEHFQHYIKSYFISSNECQKYFEALMVDPLWEVSFSMAASEAVTAVLFQPLSFASRSINSALKQLFDGLPMLVALPLVLFLFLLIIIMCNYRIRFPFFMGSLEPHATPVGSRVEEVRSSTGVLNQIEKSIFAPEIEVNGKRQVQASDVRSNGTHLANSGNSTESAEQNAIDPDNRFKQDQEGQLVNISLESALSAFNPMYTDVSDDSLTDGETGETRSDGGSSSDYEVLY